ncbi:hypothetical protein G4B88_008658 [Cannabis sativa]|uniref:CCHC-type domain-containing protein n=1 Tax=Cannabis sativa TaxID=3483 RepID=A0A7J6DJG6_CANSA|nr:hypothetical protein G4B88_008658 [Cannabis sativa]
MNCNMFDLFVLLVCMATGGCEGDLNETVDDIVSMTSKMGVNSEEDWEENEEAASSFGEQSLKGIGGWEVKVLEEDEEDSFVGITFKNREEATGILNKQPWIFNGGLLLLEKWPRSGLWREARLDMVSCWVKMKGWPIKAFTRANVVRLGEMAGEVQELRWINENRMFLNGFVRMKIGFPLKQSIFVGRYIPCGGRKFWIQLKFERLPTLCFACGIWGHEKRECGKEVLMEVSEDGLQVPKYGQWLKDDDPTPHCFSAFHQIQAEAQERNGKNMEQGGASRSELDNTTRRSTVGQPASSDVRMEAPLTRSHVTVMGSGVGCIAKSAIVGGGNTTTSMPGGRGENCGNVGILDQMGRTGNVNFTEPNLLAQLINNYTTKVNRAAISECDTQQGGGSIIEGTAEGTESEAKKRKSGGTNGDTEEEKAQRALLKGKQILNDQGASSFSGGVDIMCGSGEKGGKSSISGTRKKVSIKHRARTHGKGRAVAIRDNDGGMAKDLVGLDTIGVEQQFVFGA